MDDDHMLIFQLMRLPDTAAGNRKGQGIRPDGSMVQAWLWYLYSYSAVWLQAAVFVLSTAAAQVWYSHNT